MPLRWPGAFGAYLSSFPPQLRDELQLLFQHQEKALQDNGWLQIPPPLLPGRGGGQGGEVAPAPIPYPLPIGLGGTGLSALGSADQILAVRHDATGLQYKSLVAGLGISVVGADGTLTVANTGVASVGLSLPNIFSVSGSPVTTAGTLAASLVNQTVNTVFAGPSTGSPAAPSFRSLVAADIPSLDTSKIATGVFAAARIPDLSQGGDLTGTVSSATVAKLQGRAVSSSAPSDQQVLKYVSANSDWEPAFVTAGTNGIAAWNSSTSYAVSNLVIGSDNNLYRCVAANSNHDPTQDSGTNWVLHYLASNLTLTVNLSGTRFNGIVTIATNRTGTGGAVWDFIKYATIPKAAVLTIQLSDGTYNIDTVQLLNHPCGQQINLTGNTATPANCTLLFNNGTDGLQVNNGNTFGSVDGFTVDGSNKTANKRGCIVQGRGFILLGGHTVWQNWDRAIESSVNGTILATASGGLIKLSNWGINADTLGTISLEGWTVDGCTINVRANHGGRADLGGGTSKNGGTGFVASFAGLAITSQVTVSGNNDKLSSRLNLSLNCASIRCQWSLGDRLAAVLITS